MCARAIGNKYSGLGYIYRKVKEEVLFLLNKGRLVIGLMEYVVL